MAEPVSWERAILELAGSPNLGSRRWVYRQYDQIVRGGTFARPGGDAAVVRYPCSEKVEKLLAFACDCNGRVCELDPFGGAAMAIAEVCRNLVCVGAEPIGITDCLNFGSPERPEIMWQFARAIDGMAEACRALEVPIVSGNVSFYNETDGRAILPTPVVGAVGLVRDIGDVVRAAFPGPGLAVLQLGALRGGPLGGSEYVTSSTGEVKGPPPRLDLALEVRLQRLVLDLLRARPRLLESAHDVSDGGLVLALAECCTATDDERAMVGATIRLNESDSPEVALFGEAPSRIIVAAPENRVAEIERRAKSAGVPVTRLGNTGGDRLVIDRGSTTLASLALQDVRRAREHCLDRIVGE
jgi:phosphoribosylformylglycinamidine synthase